MQDIIGPPTTVEWCPTQECRLGHVQFSQNSEMMLSNGKGGTEERGCYTRAGGRGKQGTQGEAQGGPGLRHRPGTGPALQASTSLGVCAPVPGLLPHLVLAPGRGTRGGRAPPDVTEPPEGHDALLTAEDHVHGSFSASGVRSGQVTPRWASGSVLLWSRHLELRQPSLLPINRTEPSPRRSFWTTASAQPLKEPSEYAALGTWL